MRRYSSGAIMPATPLPQSTAIFIFRASLTSPATRSRYAARTSTLWYAPSPRATSPRSTRERSRWIASPESVVPAITILRPLYSGGLWLPVTITALCVPSSYAAK